MIKETISKSLSCRIIDTNNNIITNDKVKLDMCWKENICICKIRNLSEVKLGIKEVILFSEEHKLSSHAKIYGEGYSMLSQYAGTLEKVYPVAGFTDGGHYKLPQKEGYNIVYNLLAISSDINLHTVIGFSSCRRFTGEFRFNESKLEIAMNTEGLILKSGQEWELEELVILEGNNVNELLNKLGDRINTNHTQLEVKEVPSGWCSWYCYGPDVTETEIFRNMEAIETKVPELKYIQIDDGYQAHMGDWLTSSPTLGIDIRVLCNKIKEKGFEPAIWVAPFIADKDSELFKNHPDWFVKDEEGNPLPADKVTFGGWRLGPWYMLDGTNEEALDYIRYVFKTMREEWGCRYFKLDANMWGALPFGVRKDRNATCVEAYRRGMNAIIEGCGRDSFILGCNAPMWPSLGVVHGMRLTGDISRGWGAIKTIAREGFYRNWQQNKLWINDPDCIVLQNLDQALIGADGIEYQGSSDTTNDEYDFHYAYIYATGGLLLSGDRITELSDRNVERLKKIIPATGEGATFDDITFKVGRIRNEDEGTVCIFNWNDYEEMVKVEMGNVSDVEDFFTGEKISLLDDRLILDNMPKHSARIFKYNFK